MEIIECAPQMSNDRMYCPSTNEIIFSAEQEVDLKAEAFIAVWDSWIMDEPVITDENLLHAWEKFYEDELGEKLYRGEYIWDDFINFLANYQNREWVVYECDFHYLKIRVMPKTLVMVVKKGTVIEKEPHADSEEFEKEPQNSDEAFRDEIDTSILDALINDNGKIQKSGDASNLGKYDF